MKEKAPCTRCGKPISLNNWGEVAHFKPGLGYTHYNCDEGPQIQANAEPFWTLQHAADFLKLSKSTLRNLIRKGELDAYTLPNSRIIRLKKEDVLTLLQPK